MVGRPGSASGVAAPQSSHHLGDTSVNQSRANWGSGISEASSLDADTSRQGGIARHGGAVQVGITGGDAVTPITGFGDDPSAASSSTFIRPGVGPVAPFGAHQQQQRTPVQRNAADLSMSSFSDGRGEIGGWGAPRQNVRPAGLASSPAMGVMDHTATSGVQAFSPMSASTFEDRSPLRQPLRQPFKTDESVEELLLDDA